MKVTKAKGVVKKERQLSKRGTGLKFKTESYELISRFTSKTRIKYVPNPKRPGSKSFVRYAKYQNAKTVGEALKHCKPIDLLWEHEHGYVKVLGGPMAEQPACLAPPSTDPVIQILSHFRGGPGNSLKMDPETRKKLQGYAKQFGLNLDEVHEGAGKQCNRESSDIQTARFLANEFARRKLDTGKELTDQDIVDVLRVWGFVENEGRLNVLPEGVKAVHSDTVGVVRDRQGRWNIMEATTQYEHFSKMLCQWFTSSMAPDVPEDFCFSGININHNYAGRRHRDAGNEGPSAIKAIGKFSGGKLNYFPLDFKQPGRCEVEDLDPKDSIALDISKKFAFFNGNNAHGVEPFKGERFSLVFFSYSKFWKLPEEGQRKLQKLGFRLGTIKTIEKMKALGKTRDSRVAKTLKRR